jgi:glyoxylase-like metal-dependent hydrolase (beta-lactamase superfamily II)
MFFDTSTHDSAATLPEGYGKGINWRKTQAQTLAAQLKAIGITPDNIRYIGISHSHADHTGNVGMSPKAEVLIQRREYEQMFAKGEGPMGPPSAGGPVMTKAQPAKQLDGDYDVFGDGSVVLFFTGGHTRGHQVALVRLKNTGYVLLSGDEVHFRSNIDLRRIPRVQNANDENQWLWSVPIAFQRINAIMTHYKAQLWVHHDIADYQGRKMAPQYYE